MNVEIMCLKQMRKLVNPATVITAVKFPVLVNPEMPVEVPR